jgi:hypothetical protein
VRSPRQESNSAHGQVIWSEPRGIAAGYNWPQFSIHRDELLGILYRTVSRGSAPNGCMGDVKKSGSRSDAL